MATRDWVIVVCDSHPQRWPSVTQLVATGVPVRIAERYRRVRQEMTAGLKRRVQDARN